MKNLPAADTNTPGWLQCRLPASKKILDAMTDVERSDFEKVAERYRVEGLPNDVQRK